jgi:hypothetical protein
MERRDFSHFIIAHLWATHTEVIGVIFSGQNGLPVVQYINIQMSCTVKFSRVKYSSTCDVLYRAVATYSMELTGKCTVQ